MARSRKPHGRKPPAPAKPPGIRDDNWELLELMAFAEANDVSMAELNRKLRRRRIGRPPHHVYDLRFRYPDEYQDLLGRAREIVKTLRTSSIGDAKRKGLIEREGTPAHVFQAMWRVAMLVAKKGIHVCKAIEAVKIRGIQPRSFRNWIRKYPESWKEICGDVGLDQATRDAPPELRTRARMRIVARNWVVGSVGSRAARTLGIAPDDSNTLLSRYAYPHYWDFLVRQAREDEDLRPDELLVTEVREERTRKLIFGVRPGLGRRAQQRQRVSHGVKSRLEGHEPWRARVASPNGKTSGESRPAAEKHGRADQTDIVQYVTLDQMAGSVGRVKRTLEHYKAKMPAPCIRGGGGKPDEWDWDKIRPWLEETFGRALPVKFPAHRFH